jgi:hypothetical protein
MPHVETDPDEGEPTKEMASPSKALRVTDLILMANCILSLPKTESATLQLGKATRAIERSRRLCVKVLDLSSTRADVAPETLTAVRNWLESVPDIITHLEEGRATIVGVYRYTVHI